MRRLRGGRCDAAALLFSDPTLATKLTAVTIRNVSRQLDLHTTSLAHAMNTRRTQKRCLNKHTQRRHPTLLPMTALSGLCNLLRLSTDRNRDTITRLRFFLPSLSLLTPFPVCGGFVPLARGCVVRCVCEWNPAMCWRWYFWGFEGMNRCDREDVGGGLGDSTAPMIGGYGYGWWRRMLDFKDRQD